MSVTKKVLEIVCKIPAGKVTTYSTLAEKLRTSPRVVGQALKRNPTPIIVPCHRVICSNGRLGGFSLGVKKKKKMLIREGILVKNGRINLRVFGIKI